MPAPTNLNILVIVVGGGFLFLVVCYLAYLFREQIKAMIIYIVGVILTVVIVGGGFMLLVMGIMLACNGLTK